MKTTDFDKTKSFPMTRAAWFLGALLFSAISIADEDAEWFPSDYGPDDQLGALNRLGAKNVVDAIALVSIGKVYSLAVETNENSPDGRNRFYNVKTYTMTPSELGPNKFTGNESLIVTHDGLGTTIDGLAHAGIGRQYYNGAQETEVFPLDLGGTIRFGMETLPPIVTRGVLLDMAGYYGQEMLNAGTEFNALEIQGAAERQGIELRDGDAVIFHTGWLRNMWDDTQSYLTSQPGPGVDGAKYLVQKGVVLVGIDARTMEAVPATYSEVAPVHQELLTKNGVYILEHVDTRELHDDGVDEFLFVIGIPKLRGTVQGIVNPIAIR